MKKIAFVLFVLLVAGSMSFVKAGDNRPRIAIIDFPVDGAGLWSGFRPHKREISAALVDLFTTALVEKGNFRVFERARLQDIMKEQNLGLSGNISPDTAVKIGKLLGVQYLLTGRVTRFAYKGKSFDAFFKVGFKFKNKKLQGRLDIRLIRTDTGEIVYVDKGSGEKKFMNLRIATIGGGTDFDETMVNEIFEPIVEQMAQKMSSKVADLKITPVAMTKREGKIIKVSGSKVFINLGARNGVNTGDSYTVYRKGEALIDPDTGEELGASETKIGSLRVVSAQEKYSICTVVGGKGFKTGDIVK
ncbi:MAG: hypothetical protein GXO69_02795 [Acidobacteria bacterium]|nr:hypothetical protein [Acidobacteriota bacterium]